MTVKKNRRYLILNIVAVSLVLLVTVFVAFYFINTDETLANGDETIQLKVDKVNTVSVYAFGSGVEFVSSNNNYDIYTVEKGTSVRLQAINETRIFTGWIITESDTDTEIAGLTDEQKTNSIITLDIASDATSDIDVAVTRRNALAEDYGKYMLDRFVIVDESELLALQNILDGIGTNEDFAKFYENPSAYENNYEAAREALRKGYFLIANNFTVFNENFKGLGTEEYPFQGVVCGKNGSNSSLFITINDTEQDGVSSYGLFKYLGDEAVIRNLRVSTSIGISKAKTEIQAGYNSTIHVGGLAGVMDKSTLINVNVSTSIGIESSYIDNIYVGGIAGKVTSGTGIDSISDVVYEGTSSKWTVVSHKEDSVISAGLVAGIAIDAYIKEVDLVVTDQVVDLKNDSTTGLYTDSKLYLGNVFGSYYVSKDNQILDDIMIMGNAGETLRAITTNGEAIVGGLIGYVNAVDDGSLNFGRVYFRALKTTNKYIATTVKTTDIGNVYAAGIIGYADGTNIFGLKPFKDRFQTVKIDEEEDYVANYLYEGDYEISAVQNGTSNDPTNGKAIASGIIGKGFIDLTGSAISRSKLVLASPTSKLLIEAIQSQISSTDGIINDKEHAAASLIYGSITGTMSTSNINVYTNNTTLRSIREAGSTAIGDLHVGGFIGFASGSEFTNIGLYLNNSSIVAESLSYANVENVNTNVDTNSVFCGGFAGELLGNSSLTNIEFAGYDVNNLKMTETVGTTSTLSSVQNTIPGGKDYMGENYLGGIVGRIQHASLDNCRFIGSTSSIDSIKMSGHESPDSAFCGGIVGLIRTATNDVPSSLTNCEVANTEIIGNATCVKTYSNPDIYTGGIVGAAYMHATNISVEIANCNLTNSSVYSIGNEKIATYAGGIIAGATWESTFNITNCYVTDSTIQATSSATAEPDKALVVSAAGVLAFKAGNTVNISHCAVIDTKIDALVQNNLTKFSAYAAGIAGYNTGSASIRNCYSNALVTANHENASGTANVYGVAYNAQLNTSTKAVTNITQVVTYNNFTSNNFTFEVVSSALGTYRIKNSNNRYIRITSSGSVTTTYSTYNATTFTYENDKLEYNGKYVNFDGTNISYSDTGYDFSTIDKITVTEVENEESVICYNSYYLKKNVTNALDANVSTPVETGPFSIPNTDYNPYGNYNYFYGFDGYGQKLYLEIIDNNTDFVVTNVLDKVLSVKANTNGVALAHVWINIYENGGINDGELIIPSHENKQAAAQNGWFILDYVLLYNGGISEISSDLSNIETEYTDINGKPMDVSNNPNCTETEVVEVENANTGIVEKIKTFTFKVYDDMFTLNADFEITHFGANYKLLFVDENDEVISDADFKHKYGNIEFKLVQKHSTHEDGNYKDKYHLTFKPNEKLEKDAVVYIRFVGGNNKNAAETKFKLELIANKLTLVGVTYSEKGNAPINYYEKENLGTSENPYLLPTDSKETKFVPVFTKSNDLVQGKQYVLEEYVLKCDYSLSETSNFNFDASGKLVVGSLSESVSLTVTYGENSEEVFIKSVNSFGVNYDINGADFEGITYGSDQTNFYFEQIIRSNYSGIPTRLEITIGNTTFDLKNNPASQDGISIKKILEDGTISDEPIITYDENAKGYLVEINKELITNSLNNAVMLLAADSSAINITVEYPNVYTITFDLQCETFNDIGILTKSYKITGGTSFADFASTVNTEIENWVNSAKIYGFVFTGFYLVDSANSIQSYGISFEDLSTSAYIINSSNTFYARWSYLIEHYEAPGTYIKTGFNSEFMYDYIEDGFNHAIPIPINANQGYVFRVDKDSTYQGDVEVRAFIKTETSMTRIDVEHYQNNKNVYYISPEKITGYLVIMTKVSNSDVIVGENTSSVTEDITPEDGIITFKYIVNHYNKGGNKSYIYNITDYESLTKEFVLDFYKESDHTDLKLPDLTEIRVYYNQYINGSATPSKSIVGTYITYNDDRVYLSEFKLLDLETNAFLTTTFGETLGNHETVTEVFYFTITPPNGYSEKVTNEMANYVVECGYVNEKTTNPTIDYLEGNRTTDILANPNLDISMYQNETAKQEKVFHIVPTRQTTLEYDEDNTIYTFTDKTTYSVYDITLTNTEKLPGFNYISLYDKIDQDSILESSIMSFNIKELKLTLGYRLGEVKIYGKTSIDADWQLVNTINVTSAVYQEYTVDFKVGESYPYYAYKIDNVSTNEIRVSNIDVTSAKNGVVYKGPISNFEQTTTENTYALTHKIVGDARHEGKTFMLAIQLESSSIIENEILQGVSIRVDTAEHKVYLNDYQGKNTAYINLSNILKILNVNTIDFTIVIENQNYQIHSVQLLEVSNEFKPSQGEVRVDYTQIEVPEPEDPDTPVDNPVLHTIKLAGYANWGGTSGGYSTSRPILPINYLCDTGILTVNNGDNNLPSQNKMLLKQVQDNPDYYEIVVVKNADNIGAQNYKDDQGNIIWDFAIASASSKYNYINLYEDYLGYYIYFEGNLSKEQGSTVYDRAAEEVLSTDLNDDKLINGAVIKAHIVKYIVPPTTSTIYYDLNGGEWKDTPVNTEEYGDLYVTTQNDGTNLILPKPKKAGYKFVGWYEVGQSVGDSISVRDCLLVARWEKSSIPDGALEVGADMQYTSIQDAIDAASAGDTIYVHAGTYTEALTINKQVTIMGPNMDIEGQEERKEEAIIDGLTEITSAGVTINGLKHTKAIKVGGNNATITNCYITPTETVACNGQNRKGCIVDIANISNLTISYNYIDVKDSGAGTVSLDQFIALNSVTNLNVIGNYITNSDETDDLLYDGMSVYTCSGTINIVDNEFYWQTGGYLFVIGWTKNSCTAINVVNNVMDWNYNEKITNTTVRHTAGFSIRKGTSALTTTIMGNEIYNCTESTFMFHDDNGSSVKVKYNHFGVGTSYLTGTVVSTTKPGISFLNNYYAEAQSTTTSDANTFNSLSEYEIAYATYKGSDEYIDFIDSLNLE